MIDTLHTFRDTSRAPLVTQDHAPFQRAQPRESSRAACRCLCLFAEAVGKKWRALCSFATHTRDDGL